MTNMTDEKRFLVFRDETNDIIDVRTIGEDFPSSSALDSIVEAVRTEREFDATMYVTAVDRTRLVELADEALDLVETNIRDLLDQTRQQA